jgi:predicted regulator of Ras-like GTPase activity (Roadblock/LC7/MglB family)
VDAHAAMLAELHRLRRRMPDVSGTVLADLDGLLVVSDLPGIDAQNVAALSAAGVGIGHRFAQIVGHGPLRESIIQATGGWVICYPAGHALLTVVAYPVADLGRLHPEARAVAQRLAALWDPVRTVDDRVGGSQPADPRAPLAVRTPMASLPVDRLGGPYGERHNRYPGTY